MPNNKITNIINNSKEYIKKNSYILFFVLLTIPIAYYLADLAEVYLAMIAVLVLYDRLVIRRDNILNDKFKDACQMLDAESTITQIGGILALDSAARENQDYKRHSIEIICNHLQKEEPCSKQFAVNIFFKQDTSGTYFYEDIPANFNNTYLTDLDFSNTSLIQADFRGIISLSSTDFAGAILDQAVLTNLKNAKPFLRAKSMKETRVNEIMNEDLRDNFKNLIVESKQE